MLPVHGHLRGARNGPKYGTKCSIVPKNAAVLVLGKIGRNFDQQNIAPNVVILFLSIDLAKGAFILSRIGSELQPMGIGGAIYLRRMCCD